ncbi:MAG: hypothetical protein AB8G77_10525 [Rhodothermales bacterium]
MRIKDILFNAHVYSIITILLVRLGMKNNILILFVSLLFVSCQSAPEPADAVEPPVAEELSLRPNPQHAEEDNGIVPADWHVRLDSPDPSTVISADPDSSDIYFTTMTPGWHVTTGPAGIFYHPNSTAEGTFEASLAVHLFDPGERKEAFGMIIGGKNLDAENQTYDYFLIRNSGEFLIKRRTGAETSMLHEWTANDAIVRYTDAAESSVLNKMAVKAEDSEVIFMINDVEVARLPKDEVQTEGIVGLRVNHALNLHISDIQVNEIG